MKRGPVQSYGLGNAEYRQGTGFSLLAHTGCVLLVTLIWFMSDEAPGMMSLLASILKMRPGEEGLPLQYRVGYFYGDLAFKRKESICLGFGRKRYWWHRCFG